MASSKSNTDTARHDEIAIAINGALSPIISADAAKAEANDAMREASAGATSTREHVMELLAGASQAGGWTDKEIDVAGRLAVGKHNDKATQRTLSTFMSQAKLAMRPAVRGHFVTLRDVRNTVWAAEQAEPKDAPHPCKVAFARAAHMLTAMLGEAAEGRVHTVTTVVAFAQSRDPSLNSDRVMKRLTDAMEMLREVYDAAQLDDIKVAIESLEQVKAVHVKAVMVPTTVVQAPAPVVAAPVNVVAASVTPATGAVDILDDILSERAA